MAHVTSGLAGYGAVTWGPAGGSWDIFIVQDIYIRELAMHT